MKISVILLIVLGLPVYFLILIMLLDFATSVIYEIMDNVEDIKVKLYDMKHKKDGFK